MHACITVKNKDWKSISTMLRTETIPFSFVLIKQIHACLLFARCLTVDGEKTV